MKREGKKYTIKESELKEIIQEMLLMEVYNPNDYKDMYTSNYKGSIPNLGDYANGAINVVKSLFNGNGSGSTNSNFLGGLFGGLYQQPQVVDNSPNANAEQPLNVTAASNWIRANANRPYNKDYCGYCARYVRLALNAGGLKVPHGMPAGDAKDYLTVLPSNGWDEIPINQAGQPGDVIVIAPHGTHPRGHIAMCAGNGQWFSDYAQNSIHGLRKEPPQGTMHVFRYRNRV